MHGTDETVPKIYVWCELDFGGNLIASATAEDGTCVVQHLCSSRIYVRHDMGLIGRRKHDAYDDHYPEGYELVDLVDLTLDELDEHEGLNDAFMKGETNGHWDEDQMD